MGYRGNAPASRRSAKAGSAFRESKGFEKQLTQPQRKRSLSFCIAAAKEGPPIPKESVNTFVCGWVYVRHWRAGKLLAIKPGFRYNKENPRKGES